MRISEAIKLDDADIDRQQGVLLVRESKFNKSRYLPLHAQHPGRARALRPPARPALPEPTRSELLRLAAPATA
jgi:site-specific recombinase XerD